MSFWDLKSVAYLVESSLPLEALGQSILIQVVLPFLIIFYKVVLRLVLHSFAYGHKTLPAVFLRDSPSNVLCLEFRSFDLVLADRPLLV